MKQNNMLAMILAGGRGSRLHELTKKVAKPAVSYGGKYRIIDFPLSNCANSGIDVVGVLTQYESILLNSYVAAGRRWGLDAKDSGVYVLPPRETAETDLNVYRGTADAISQNIDFIDTFSPEYILILSGDHIYKMNYAKMLAAHKAHDADATIAVIEVPIKEASRFGIMNTDENERIIEFEEKPEKVFVIHGEDSVCQLFTERLKNEMQLDATAPYSGTIYNLATGVCEKESQPVHVVKTEKTLSKAAKANTPFARLLAAGQRLLTVIRHNEGGANKDLARFTSQINSLCDKWDR